MNDKSELIADKILNPLTVERRFDVISGKSIDLIDKAEAKATLQKAFREVEIEAALFALDNETLWQYRRKCNAGEASKANRAWIINLLESNISNYKAELTKIKE